MARWGKTSRARLDTCDDRLQYVFDEVIERLPWTDPVSGITIEDAGIICGHRNEEDQNAAVRDGFSRTPWPTGKHNSLPSVAVDSLPYHADLPGGYNWNNKDEHEAYKRLVFECAADIGVTLRWGMDWDRDGVRGDHDPDETLIDGPHYELWNEDNG